MTPAELRKSRRLAIAIANAGFVFNDLNSGIHELATAWPCKRNHPHDAIRPNNRGVLYCPRCQAENKREAREADPENERKKRRDYYYRNLEVERRKAREYQHRKRVTA